MKRRPHPPPPNSPHYGTCVLCLIISGHFVPPSIATKITHKRPKMPQPTYPPQKKGDPKKKPNQKKKLICFCGQAFYFLVILFLGETQGAGRWKTFQSLPYPEWASVIGCDDSSNLSRRLYSSALSSCRRLSPFLKVPGSNSAVVVRVLVRLHSIAAPHQAFLSFPLLCSALLSSTEKSISHLLLLQIVLGRNGNGYSMCLHGVCGTDGLETGVGIGQQGRQQ